MALTLDDLPTGFEPFPEEAVSAMEADFPDGSSSYGFEDRLHSQVVMGILIPYKTRVEQSTFNSMLPEFVQLMAKAIDADTNLKPLTGLDEIGQTRGYHRDKPVIQPVTALGYRQLAGIT